MNPNNIKVIVTGAAGMIGNYVVRELLKFGYKVIGIDNLWRGKKKYLADIEGFDLEKDFILADLTKEIEIKSLEKIFKEKYHIIHLADIVAGIGYVFNNEHSIFRENLLINSNLISLAKKINTEKFIYVGTACSFPKHLQNGINSVLNEEMLFPAIPESSYGWSKLIGTLEMSYAFQNSKIDYCTLLLHNVYGKYCDFDEKSSQVIPSLISKTLKLNNNNKLEIWGNGEQSRSFIHAEDVAKAIRSYLEKKSLIPDIIQIGPQKGTTIKDLAEIILTLENKNNLLIYDESKPTGDFGRSCDCKLAKEYLNWEPEIELKEGLRDLYFWIKSEIK